MANPHCDSRKRDAQQKPPEQPSVGAPPTGFEDQADLRALVRTFVKRVLDGERQRRGSFSAAARKRPANPFPTEIPSDYNR